MIGIQNVTVYLSTYCLIKAKNVPEYSVFGSFEDCKIAAKKLIFLLRIIRVAYLLVFYRLDKCRVTECLRPALQKFLGQISLELSESFLETYILRKAITMTQVPCVDTDWSVIENI